jgi:serine/threonine protein kinase
MKFGFWPPFDTPTWSATKKHSGRITHHRCGFLKSIIMEYCDRGDLHQKISMHKKNETLFDEREIWNVIVQILIGLRELHSQGICHRDLKSANIFLAKVGVVKIGDLNVSKIAKKGLLSTQTGTPYYASPEVWRDVPYDHKSDMWSLGCIIYEMAALEPPFHAETMEGLYKEIQKANYKNISLKYSKDLSDFIKSLLRVNPNDRMDCEALLSSNFIQEKTDNRFKLILEGSQRNSGFLKTIMVPDNPLKLSNLMPKANYEPLNYRRADRFLKNSSVEYTGRPSMNSQISTSFSTLNTNSSQKMIIGEASLKENRLKGNLPALNNRRPSLLKLVSIENRDFLDHYLRQRRQTSEICEKSKLKIIANLAKENENLTKLSIEGISQASPLYSINRLKKRRKIRLQPIFGNQL